MTTGSFILILPSSLTLTTLPLDPPFHISQTTTGDGAVATRPIRTGQLLFVENEPLVIQPENASEQSILAALCHLPPARSQAFFTLSTSLDRKTPIRDIFQTNALPLGPCVPVCPSEPDMAYGVFTTLSRLNNSCTPNAAATWNDVTQRMSLHALRPIATNEEITISYGQPLFATRAERRSYLKRTRGFDCFCGACRSTDPSSDARREELKRLFTSIPFVPDPATGVKMVRISLHRQPLSRLSCDAPMANHIAQVLQALQTLRTEGIDLCADVLAYDAAQFCFAASDVKHGREWLQFAYDHKCRASGVESETAQFFANCLQSSSPSDPLASHNRPMILWGPPS